MQVFAKGAQPGMWLAGGGLRAPQFRDEGLDLFADAVHGGFRTADQFAAARLRAEQVAELAFGFLALLRRQGFVVSCRPQFAQLQSQRGQGVLTQETTAGAFFDHATDGADVGPRPVISRGGFDGAEALEQRAAIHPVFPNDRMDRLQGRVFQKVVDETQGAAIADETALAMRDQLPHAEVQAQLMRGRARRGRVRGGLRRVADSQELPHCGDLLRGGVEQVQEQIAWEGLGHSWVGDGSRVACCPTLPKMGHARQKNTAPVGGVSGRAMST